MSTNYYAHIIPSKERKKELYDAIKADDFKLVEKLTDKMYSTLHRNWDNEEIIGGIVHLGKGSGGWKFLWNPNIFVIRHGHIEEAGGEREWVNDPSTGKYMYPLTKKGIKDFIDREDICIYDEYGELQDKGEFWEMALSWGYDKDDEGWDSASYEEYERREHNYKQYPITGELTDFLRQEGYKFTSITNSDFYSDGLRFSGFTEFS